jgi:hypothetical protein
MSAERHYLVIRRGTGVARPNAPAETLRTRCPGASVFTRERVGNFAVVSLLI